MIVDDLRSEARDGGVLRSARIRWIGGELRLGVRVPATAAGPAQDASPFLAAALLPAMRRHEDLEVRGAVSPMLLGRCEELQAMYHSWDLSLRRCSVRAAHVAAPPGPHGRADGAFFSRGVDSMYSAMAARRHPLGGLVFCSDLDPIHSPPVQAREEELASEAADALGLPLTVVSSNIRELTEPILNWADAHGAGLAFLALSLGGGFSRMTIPSWADYETLAPCGSHPLLDPLFSTEAVSVEHDATVLTRPGKVGALVENRPDLLPLLKVCFRVDGPGNCGRCIKCLLTMSCLHAHGALGAATMFPPEIDVERLGRLRLHARRQWVQVCRALAPADPVRKAIERALRRTAAPTLRERLRGRMRPAGRLDLLPPPWYSGASAFFRHDTNTAVSVLRDGRPYP